MITKFDNYKNQISFKSAIHIITPRQFQSILYPSTGNPAVKSDEIVPAEGRVDHTITHKRQGLTLGAECCTAGGGVSENRELCLYHANPLIYDDSSKAQEASVQLREKVGKLEQIEQKPEGFQTGGDRSPESKALKKEIDNNTGDLIDYSVLWGQKLPTATSIYYSSEGNSELGINPNTWVICIEPSRQTHLKRHTDQKTIDSKLDQGIAGLKQLYQQVDIAPHVNLIVHGKEIDTGHNSLIKPTRPYSGWKETNLLQRAANLRYPVATAITAAGLTLGLADGVNPAEARMLAALPSVLAADAAAVIVDDKKIPLQGKSEQEIAQHLIDASTKTCLSEPDDSSKEYRLKNTVGQIARANAPAALSELERGYSSPLPVSGLANFFEAVNSSWKAAGIISNCENGVSLDKIVNFVQIQGAAKETAKDILKQYNPDVIDDAIDLARNQGLNTEQLNFILSEQILNKPIMPELAPRLQEKLATC